MDLLAMVKGMKGGERFSWEGRAPGNLPAKGQDFFVRRLDEDEAAIEHGDYRIGYDTNPNHWRYGTAEEAAAALEKFLGKR